MLTRWRSDRVEILHHTLQVPHLVVQLLRAVAVAGLDLDAVSETVTGSVLRVENLRRPHLRHHRHRGEVEAPRVDGGRRRHL